VRSARAAFLLVLALALGDRPVPAALAAFQSFGEAQGFAVDATEDPGAFTPSNLDRYAAVVFLLTTGDVLDSAQQNAFMGYVRSGGGWMGVHSASDTEYDWPWYEGLLGAYFDGHPAIQSARVRVVRSDHPATSDLPDPWTRTDEWYNFRDNPKQRGAIVLLNLEEGSYSGGTMGADHPIAWYHDYDGGRAFYTAGGHTQESYSDPSFRAHLLGGLLSVMATPGPPPPPPPPDDTEILVRNGRFRLEATFRIPGGPATEAHLKAITSDTASLWFFNAANVEAVVKVLDGCGVNGRYWVFAGGLTNLRVDLTVTDTRNGQVKRYANPQGRAFQPIQDTSAFATCP
jgi:type 1 glutamine amidotransferase